MKKGIVFYFVLFASYAFAQQETIKVAEFTATFGPIAPNIKTHLWECSAPNSKGGVTVVSNKLARTSYENEIAVHIFDEKANPVNLIKTGKLKFIGKDVFTEKYIKDKDKCHWFYSTESGNATALYYRTFNMETGAMGEEKKVIEIKKKLGTCSRPSSISYYEIHSYRFLWTFSPDSSKILLSYFQVGEKNKRTMLMMDNSFNILWEKQQDFPFIDELNFNMKIIPIRHFQEQVLNDGTIVSLYRVYENKTSGSKFHDELHLFNKDNSIAKIILDIRNLYINDLNLLLMRIMG